MTIACQRERRDGDPPPCDLPSGAPANHAFCEAVASFYGRCGQCKVCATENLRNCQQRGGAVSEAHRAAIIACPDDAPCSSRASIVGCIAERMASATPTPAQIQAKSAYCAACGAKYAAECDGYFDVNAETGEHGVGYNVLLASDDTVKRAKTACAAACEKSGYAACVGRILCTDSGGDSCGDNGACAWE